MAHRIGRWSKLFEGRKSFAEEAPSAVAIQADWSVESDRCAVVTEALEGWTQPLWGADGSWLYLRRPQGIWKTPVPKAWRSGLDLTVYARKADAQHERDVTGHMWIGRHDRDVMTLGGWRYDDPLGRILDAADMDDLRSPAAHGVEVDAELLGDKLVETVLGDDGILRVDAGDDFDSPPAFEYRDGWLIARGADGLSVAHETFEGSEAREALLEGRLTLRYWSWWLPGFDAPVRLR